MCYCIEWNVYIHKCIAFWAWKHDPQVKIICKRLMLLVIKRAVRKFVHIESITKQFFILLRSSCFFYQPVISWTEISDRWYARIYIGFPKRFLNIQWNMSEFKLNKKTIRQLDCLRSDVCETDLHYSTIHNDTEQKHEDFETCSSTPLFDWIYISASINYSNLSLFVR